jgi:hypothetical protein
MHNLPIPSVPDGFDGNPIVERAWHALICFGSDLNRSDAATLLSMWRFSPELSSREHTAILARFPARETPPVPDQVDGHRIAGRTRRRSFGGIL